MNNSLLGPWIRRFLLEHLVGERNLAHNTQASYRDTLILLLPFIAQTAKKRIDRLSLEHLTPERIRSFLAYVERTRACSITTRNQRLAALHAFARFVGERRPEHLDWCIELRAIPFKKTSKPVMPYLDKPEIDVLLDAPDASTEQGIRDYAMLLFLYNTGARANEAAHVIIDDLELDHIRSVRIRGKGGKVRSCPLWSLTVKTLIPLVAGRHGNEPVFLNCRKQQMTRFGVHALVKRYAGKVAEKMPSFHKKRVSAHTIRHTTAVHLLRAGVDINTIREPGWATCRSILLTSTQKSILI